MTVIDEPWVCQADRDKQDEERVMSEIAPPAVCQVHGVTCQFAQDVSMPEYSCVGKCQYEDREAKSKEMPADILDTTNKLVNDYVNPHEPRPDYRPDLRKRIAAALLAERERCAKIIEDMAMSEWQPIAEADKDIATIIDAGEFRIGNSYPIWVRDEDGRVYEALWSDNGKKAYWWDIEGESPVDPVEFMPHPLDPRFDHALDASPNPTKTITRRKTP